VQDQDDFELKTIAGAAITKALEKAEVYRLLNDPEQAESICLDILRADSDNQEVLVLLILAMTDQFGTHNAPNLRSLNGYIDRLKDEYKKCYYAGIIAERRARASLRRGSIGGNLAYEELRKAMDLYERAEALRPPNNDDPQLRWNSCVRTLRRSQLGPGIEDDVPQFLE
jgi:hypothetical protein